MLQLGMKLAIVLILMMDSYLFPSSIWRISNTTLNSTLKHQWFDIHVVS